MTTYASATAVPDAERDRRGQTAADLEACLLELEMRAGSDTFRSFVAPAEHAERAAADLDRQDLRMRARLVLADVAIRSGDTAQAGRICRDVLRWTTANPHAYVLARVHSQLAVFHSHVGNLADALSHAVYCVSHTADDVHPGIRARHLTVLAMTLDENGSTDEGRRRFADALDLATLAGDNEMILRILNNMAYTAYENGDDLAARELVERMRTVAARQGVTPRANYLDTIARVEMMSGRYAEAEAGLVTAVSEAGGHLLTEGNALTECLLTMAEAQRLQGAADRAQASLDRATLVCEERGLYAHRNRVREEQALLYAATGRYQEAFEEHRRFYAESKVLQSAERDARARALQAVYEAEEARRTSERFQEMAHRDALTGLYNRRFVNERLPVLIHGAVEREEELSVALLDLDHFKLINDTLSHQAGDAVLQQIAELLDAATPAVAARMGGEEFLLIMAGSAHRDAVAFGERLCAAIRAHDWTPVTGDRPVTASVGVASVPATGITVSALLGHADRNLYAAKRAGRDRVVGDPTG